MANSIILGRHHFLHVEIRRVSAMRAVEWLRRGWDDVMHMKAASLGHGALITALGAILLMLGSSHAYLVAAAISGYLLVGPDHDDGALRAVASQGERREAGV